MGPPGRAPRADGGRSAGGPRRTTRRSAARGRRGRTASARGRRRAAADGGAPRLDPRPRDGQGGRASRSACSTTTTSAARGSSGSSPPDVTPEAFAPRRGAELGDFRDGTFPIDHLAPGQVSLSREGTVARPAAHRHARRSASSGDRLRTRRWRSRSRSTTAAPRRSTRGSGSSGRSTCSAAAATRRPGTTSAASAPRTTAPARRRGSTRSAMATTGSAWRSRPRPTPAADAWWSADRDRLQLRVRLRARLPGQRPAAVVAADARARRVRRFAVRSRSPSPATGPAEPSRARPHPRDRCPLPRDPRPARRPCPLLPAVPRRPVHGPRSPTTAPPRRSATGTSGSPPSATARSRSSASPARVSWNLGATLTAYLAREAPTVLARSPSRTGGGGTGIAQSFHHSILPLASLADRRTEILWGLRDFAYRFGRQATAMWLPETAVDLATLRVAAEAGVKAVVLAPWQAEAGHVDPRRPYRVDVGGGRHITAMFYDGDLSAAGLVRARRDRRRGPVRPRADRAPARGRPPRRRRRPRSSSPRDGELYGHHQSFRDLFLQRLVAPEARRRPRRSTSSALHDGGGRARGPAASRDPDPRPDLVELPPRRAALDRRVPGRPGRPLEGAAARGARAARRRHRRRHRGGRPRHPAASTIRGRRATGTWTW